MVALRNSSPVDSCLAGKLCFVTDDNSGTVIAVNTVDKAANIKRNDISLLQRPAIRDSMTDNFIDGTTQRFRKSSVIQRRRVSAGIYDGVVNFRVDFIRCHTRLGHTTG